MSFETILIFVAIVLISAVSNWVKQRQAKAEEDAEEVSPLAGKSRDAGRPSPAEPPAETQKPRRGFNWEEELKRLLEGTLGEKSESSPPVSPAAPATVAPPGRPPSPVMQAPPVVDRRSTATAVPAPVEATVHELAERAEVKARALRARELRVRTDAILARTAGRIEGEARGAVSVGADLAGQLTSLTGAQQAILASVVLGPPKAFEPEGGLPGSAGFV